MTHKCDCRRDGKKCNRNAKYAIAYTGMKWAGGRGTWGCHEGYACEHCRETLERATNPAHNSHIRDLVVTPLQAN